MSNSDVFGSPMILTGKKPVSPFGAASSNHPSTAAVANTGRRLLQALRGLFTGHTHDRRVHQTVRALSRLDDRTLKDIGLDRSAIISTARQAVDGRREYGREHM